MELDDLKKTWQQAPLQKITNTDIMELIQHKSYGPLSALKRAYKKDMRLMIILPLIIIFTNLEDGSRLLTSILFWTYVAFCAGLVVYSYSNYRIVARMEAMPSSVRSNIEQQIAILETRVRWHTKGVRIALLVFILLTETLPYVQHYRMLDKWHSLSPVIRFGSYAALFALQYLVSRRVMKRKYGEHIAYLKKLVGEMQY